MRKLILPLVMAGSLSALAVDQQPIYISIGSDAVSSGQKVLSGFEVVKDNGEIAVVKISPKEVESLSEVMHHDHLRCGGFVHHESLEEALQTMQGADRGLAKNFLFADYSINQGEVVESLIEQVDEFEIRSSILKMSEFHNRYYNAKSGVDSQAWLKAKWEELSAARSDVKVEFYNHSKWLQPSVVMTIEGSSKKDEIVVIGGHADSISGWWGQAGNRAPGADDNASGISTITEVIRIIMKNGFKPERTVKFMGYAAEEVGLRGSKEIADSFKAKSLNVVGVMQLDMTNHKGTSTKDIVFMTDYTNQAQNEFMAKLVDTYVGVPWGYSKCGYGCSDHASWHNQGFPASIPFESTMADINNKIHTDRDTIDVSGGNADHAVKFAKLAIAYLVELAN